MRCPSCQKFTGLENGEPEVNLDYSPPDDLSDDVLGSISGDIRMTRNCADCSDTLKEYNESVEVTLLECLDQDVAKARREHEAAKTKKGYKAPVVEPAFKDEETEKLKAHLAGKGDHELEVEFEDGQVDEGGGGRFAKNMISCTVGFTVRCACQKAGADGVCHGEVVVETNAGSFEECC